MAREIKFRAWDKGHNKMTHKVNLYSLGHDGSMNKAQLDNQQVMKGVGLACEIMQFTGLKDKNGVEIYEGDIVTFRDSGRTGEIKWQQNLSAFYISYKVGTKHFYSELKPDYGDGIGFWLTGTEVIGNIYENQDLIN